MSERPDWSFVRNIARGVGKTTAMADAVRKIGGVLIVRGSEEARRVNGEYGIGARSYHSPLGLYGSGLPVLFDPDAVALICYDYERTFGALSEELVGLRALVEYQRKAIEVKDEALRHVRIVLVSALPGKESAKIGDWDREYVVSRIDKAMAARPPSETKEYKTTQYGACIEHGYIGPGYCRECAGEPKEAA